MLRKAADIISNALTAPQLVPDRSHLPKGVAEIVGRLAADANAAIAGEGHLVKTAVISMLQRQLVEGEAAVWGQAASDMATFCNALAALGLRGTAIPVVLAAHGAALATRSGARIASQPSLGALAGGRDRYARVTTVLPCCKRPCL